jgi:hypothetical protein
VAFQGRLDAAIAELRKRLTAPPLHWEVHMPVLGLDPAGLPARIAGVRFRTATTSVVRSWKRRSFSIINGMTDPPETRAAVKEMMADQFESDFRGRTFASLSVDAIDQIAAMMGARRLLRTTLDAINFYSDLLYPPGVRAFVYPLGERESVGVRPLVFQQDKQFSMPGAREGPLKKFVLRDLHSKRARDFGASSIFQWLGSGTRTAFQQRVVTAFGWAGRATADDPREEAFLLYLISLESLILGEKADRELSYRLKVRCAHLLGRTPV